MGHLSPGLLLPSRRYPPDAPSTCLGDVVLVDTRHPPVSFHQVPLVGVAGDPLLLRARTALPVTAAGKGRRGEGSTGERGISEGRGPEGRGVPEGRGPRGKKWVRGSGAPGSRAGPPGEGVEWRPGGPALR